MAKKSYYDILGIKRSASPDEIKKAFRKLARTHHPDAGGNEETFKQINEAYEVLSDPEKKTQYDRYGQYMGTMGGATGGYAGGHGGWGGEQGQPSSWAEVLESMRRGEGAFGSSWEMPRRPVRGTDLQVTLEVAFDEAFSGTQKKVTIRIPSTGEKQEMSVKVPAGAVDGGKLRYHGKGEYGSDGGERGDLIIITRVKPHEYYERKGADVLLELPISIYEAALGAQVVVPAPDSTMVKLRIPAGTQEGRIFRIKDKGAPNVKGTGRGSLKVTIHIVVPEHLDSKAQSLLEELLKADTADVRAHFPAATRAADASARKSAEQDQTEKDAKVEA